MKTGLGPKGQVGRLLNEFLVSLAILFLAMMGNFVVIQSVAGTTERASVSSRALFLANEGIEAVITHPEKYRHLVTENFGAGRGESFDETFSRRSSLVSVKHGDLTLSKAIVTVEWGEGTQRINLERYVRTDR